MTLVDLTAFVAAAAQHAAPEPEPRQPTVQATASLLDALYDFLCRFVAFPEPEQADAIALWVLHSHAFEAAEATPHLALLSCEKRSGKTRVLEVLDLLVRNPLTVASITAATLFRAVAEGPVTLLIDEVDAIFDRQGGRAEELRGLLNAGYRRGGAVARVAKGSDGIQRLPVFAPVALAGIGMLPDTIQDRSIVIRLKRRRNTDIVERLHRREVEPDASALCAQIARWAHEHVDALATMRPEVPGELGDRAADVWEPLLAIADCAGEDWTRRARVASISLSAQAATQDTNRGAQLLADIRRVLQEYEGDRVPSVELVAALRDLEDAPWDETLDPRVLARLLRPYEIQPQLLRIGETVIRGYAKRDFADAFSRYLPAVVWRDGWVSV